MVYHSKGLIIIRKMKMTNKLCSICLELNENANTITLPNCNHVLHSSCFCQYIKVNDGYRITCPLCREDIISIRPKVLVLPYEQLQYIHHQHVQTRPSRLLNRIKKTFCFST